MRPPEFLLFQADALRIPLADKSVHCVVCSPPYFSLRDYGTAKWIGGDPACDHQAPIEGGKSGNKGQYQRHAGRFAGPACYRCGAQRIDRQIGLEESPSDYVAALVAAFAEVHRVLRDDGVLWINISSSYAGSWGNQGRKQGRGTQRPINGPILQNLEPYPDKGSCTGTIPKGSSLKPKDLIFIPAMLALELQKPRTVPTCIKSEVNKAWLAALIDGEGCIGINRYDSHSIGSDGQRCQEGFVPYVTIANNDRELLDRCVAITGFGNVRVKNTPNPNAYGVLRRRVGYGWRLDGNKAIEVILAVYPYLIAKRRQAILAYTLDLSNKRGRDLRGNGPLPSDEQERRALLKTLINRCNQREPADIPSWCEEPRQLIEPGWHLRADCIFNKRNGMPSSVKDRPTMSHEYVFLLTKKARYFYDGVAVAEPGNPEGSHSQGGTGARPDVDIRGGNQANGNDFVTPEHGRNCRSVWTFNVASFPGSHYAVMAPDLAERCIKAGTSQAGCCPRCLAPYRRVVERTKVIAKDYEGKHLATDKHASGRRMLANMRARREAGNAHDVPFPAPKTLGWMPGCKCDAGDPVPCRVLDSFGGVATTALVAVGLGRDGICCDLSAKYLKMGQRRIERPHAPVQRAPSPNRPEKPTPLFKDDE
jgi:hypothetical protein